jgi:GH24 family phage-related lysozyme (muramidase)
MKNNYLEYDWNPIINFESGGEFYYNKFLKKMTYPGGASGVTMGIGADLGYMSIDEFNLYFSKYFTKDENIKLKSVINLKGESAKKAIKKLNGIELSWEDASEAFVEWTLPKFWRLTNILWKGIDQLCENAQIGLVSLVFNRGISTKGSSRIEMLNIKPLVLKKDYKGIAKEIRKMKRLWENKNMDGLLKRREEEAKMVESCI